MRRLIPIIGILASLVVAASASASTKAQAKHAVKHEIALDHPDYQDIFVNCTRLTPVRFKCHWQMWTVADYDNVLGWLGTARVRFYGRVADVSLHVTHRGS